MTTDKLEVSVVESDIRDYVLFLKNGDWKQITEPGLYECDCITISGVTGVRQGESYRTTFGSSTGWYFTSRYMPSLPDWARQIISERGFYTGGGGRKTAPGCYFIFNGRLFSSKEAAMKHSDWLFGGR